LPSRRTADSSKNAACLVILGIVAAVLLGYHPYAEDGGIYSSALSLRLHPNLFPAYRGFVIAHTGKSAFLPLVAGLVRITHLSQAWMAFLLYVFSTVLTAFASCQLAGEFFRKRRTRLYAVCLFMFSQGLPVAGTSLYLADPYLTARSFSTPLFLFALALLLQRRYLLVAAYLLFAFALHPLMTTWAVVFALFVWIVQRSRKPLRGCVMAGLVLAVLLAVLQVVLPPETSAVQAAAVSRGYWFLSNWQWYEWIGIAGPLAILVTFERVFANTQRYSPQAVTAIRAAIAASITVSLTSLLLIHTSNSNFLLARIQPLRLLHITTMFFMLLLGGWIVETFWQRSRGVLPVSLIVVAAVMLLYMQTDLYGNSRWLELPGVASNNGYVQAFEWIRGNTPEDAVIAADAFYTTARGEDAQMLRAIALRSSAPDAAKDGGIASVVPVLAPAWFYASQMQHDLNTLSDAERAQRMRAVGATWIVLPASATTAFPCPYSNAVARVCRLP